jgi:hypothetical protein
MFPVGALFLTMTGLTRLYCEAGVFAMQMYEFPSRLLQQVVPPSALGSATLVKVTVWDRAMVSDWFRVAFMPVIMNNLHLATRTGLRRRAAMLGMMLAVVLALAASFGSVLYTCYTRPGGANTMQWYFHSFPSWEYGPLTAKLQQMKSYGKKLAETQEVMTKEDVPDVARRDWILISCEGLGAAFMCLSLWLRRFVMWWPHPIGYVMWMAFYPHYRVWFSFFLGWALKKMILKYGGSRFYLRSKRFFIGLVVGEALGLIFWKIMAAWFGNLSGYGMLPA